MSEAPADYDGEDVTPAISKLISVNMTQQKLDAVIADLFHRIVAGFLYVAKRARPDQQVIIVFLCKRVT